jgi:ribosomal protein L37AE/L43A
MTDIILEACPECGEINPEKIVNTSIWFECKTCGYCEDQFKGPTFSRHGNPLGGLIQYL